MLDALTLRVTDAAIAWLIQRNHQRGVHRIFYGKRKNVTALARFGRRGNHDPGLLRAVR
jgi:hypothetical protein